MNSGRVLLSIWGHLAFPIPSKWCTADIMLSIWVLLNGHSEASKFYYIFCSFFFTPFFFPLLSAHRCLKFSTKTIFEQPRRLLCRGAAVGLSLELFFKKGSNRGWGDWLGSRYKSNPNSCIRHKLELQVHRHPWRESTELLWWRRTHRQRRCGPKSCCCHQ